MPRNASGAYSLPELPFVAGTVIQSAPVNSNYDDIGDTLTLSLATTGVSEMTGAFKAADGSLSAPGITFANALGTGWALTDTDEVSYIVNGVLAVTYNADLTVDFEAAIGLGNATDVDPLHLDWYEEGTFVPVLEFGGASVGLTYTFRAGWFTRIGNKVFFSIHVIINSNGSSEGAATVSGLPYAADSPTNSDTIVQLALGANIFMGNFAETEDDNGAYVFGIIRDGATEIEFHRRYFDEGFSTEFGHNEGSAFIDDNAEFSISGHYTVAT